MSNHEKQKIKSNKANKWFIPDSKCPECGAKIDLLYWRTTMEGNFRRGWEYETASADSEYFCSECETVLFSNRDNATVFLKNKTYPNDTALYKCSRCKVLVNKVYYQVVPRGDLCEKCHDAFKHLNMQCKVVDGGSIDYMKYSRELGHLWEIKLKTGKPIAEQISEAIKDYGAKHLLALEEKDLIRIENKD